MKLIIDIPEEKYDVIKSDLYNTFPAEMKEWGLEAIRKGTSLPDGAEILTKETYSDLCLRATAYDDLYLRASRAYGGDTE